MDVSETFSPGPRVVGLSEMAFLSSLCIAGQCTHGTTCWLTWRREEIPSY